MPTQEGPIAYAGWKRDPEPLYAGSIPTVTVVTHRVPLLSEGIGAAPVLSPGVMGASSGIGSLPPTITGYHTGGPLAVRANYDGLDGILAATFGHEAMRIGATIMPENLGNGVYRHIYELNPTHQARWGLDDGLTLDAGVHLEERKCCRGTWVVSKQTATWETSGVMFNRLRFTAPRFDLASLDFETIGYALVEPATTNTAPAAMMPYQRLALLPDHCEFRIGVWSSSVALDSSTVVLGLPITMTLDNALGYDYNPIHQLQPGDIQRKSALSASASFAVPSYSSDTLYGWHRAQTLLMVTAKWTGPLIAGGGGQQYAFRLYFPACRISALPYSTQAGRQELACTLSLEAPSAPTAGFPSVSHGNGMVFLETIGTMSAHQFL